MENVKATPPRTTSVETKITLTEKAPRSRAPPRRGPIPANRVKPVSQRSDVEGRRRLTSFLPTVVPPGLPHYRAPRVLVNVSFLPLQRRCLPV
jgi:hypothetical protein